MQRRYNSFVTWDTPNSMQLPCLPSCSTRRSAIVAIMATVCNKVYPDTQYLARILNPPWNQVFAGCNDKSNIFC